MYQVTAKEGKEKKKKQMGIWNYLFFV
jgi:hypothetical protein